LEINNKIFKSITLFKKQFIFIFSTNILLTKKCLYFKNYT